MLHEKLIKEITNEVYRLKASDEGLHKSIVSRLKHVYGTKNRSKSIIHRLRRNPDISFVPVNDRYKRNDNFKPPFVDDNVANIIRQNDPTICGPLPPDIREADVHRSTESAIGRYTRTDRFWSKRDIRALTSAGLSAAYAMNLIDPHSINEVISPQDAVEKLSKNSNSGWPLFRKKNTTSAKADTLDWLNMITNNPTVYSIFNNPVIEQPSYKFNRFQIKFDFDEMLSEWGIREVWCVPFRIVSLQCMFFFNAQLRYKESNFVHPEPLTNAGLDDTAVSSRIVSRLRNFLHLDIRKCLFATDYSKFDSTVPAVAWDIWYCMHRRHMSLTETYSKLFDLLRYYDKHSPCVVDNSFIMFMKGVSSGAFTTHIFDTWWNLTLWYLTHHAMQQDIVTQNDIVKNISVYPLLSHKIYDNPFFYDRRKDIALCGDDTLIFTSADEIILHSYLCTEIGMKVSTRLRTCNPSDKCFFLGTYWDKDSKPFQSFEYMFLHIVCRSKWYHKNELPFPIRDLVFHRSIGICQKFTNGWDFLTRAFGKWSRFKEFLRTHTYYYNMKDFPEEDYLTQQLIMRV